MGRCRPLRSSSPSASSSAVFSTATWTRPSTKICRSLACAHRREPRLTTVPVAEEMLQCTFEPVDRFAETAIIFLQHGDDVFRLGVLGKCGKAAKVAEYGGDIAAVSLQELLVRDHEFGDLRR